MASYDDTATVSGSVVSIENGADDVPTKSVKIAIPASLSGVSAVSVVNSGKNSLSSAEADTKTHNSVSITCDGNGKYTATGTATGGSANITFILDTPCEIKSGMYLHLMNVSANASVSITLQKQDNTTIYAPALSPANRIADLSSYAGQTIYSIRFYIANGATFEMTLTPMLCFSNTATTFEPYTTPTTYTATLGRTIYGGEVDIVKGVGTGTYGIYTVTSASDIGRNDGQRYYIIQSKTGAKIPSANEASVISDKLPSGLPSGAYHNLVWLNPNGAIRWDTDTNYPTTADMLADFGGSITFVYPLATQTDFTFTGQEVPTRLGYNAFWSEQGDTEVTYYKDGYGFTSVTVNKTGKNLIDGTKFTRGLPSTTIGASIDTITASNRYAYYGIRAGGGSLTVSSTSSDTDYFTLVLIYGYKNGVLTYYSNTQAGTSKTVDFSNCDYVRIGIGAKSGTTVPTDLTGYGTIQLELGSQASSYEPYEAVTKTAKFHKVIYGGQADVVKGTCEPKNLMKYPYATNSGTISKNIEFTYDDNGLIHLEGDHTTTGNAVFYLDDDVNLKKLPSGNYVFSQTGYTFTASNDTIQITVVKKSDGTITKRIQLNGNTTSKNFTVLDTECIHDAFIRISPHSIDSDVSVMLESGETKTDFVPYFDPFTFPPISMETDEGENTLFANEGESSITYRKAVD